MKLREYRSSNPGVASSNLAALPKSLLPFDRLAFRSRELP
jgi:hypothetical protein